VVGGGRSIKAPRNPGGSSRVEGAQAPSASTSAKVALSVNRFEL